MSDTHITIGKYQGVPVGQGGFATVFRVIDPSGGIFALKLADPSADEAIRASLFHEYTVQSELIHPQVVRARDFGLFDGRPYIVLEWVEGTSFFDQFPSPDADEFVTLLRQLARGLYFIHHRNWVHGDLKPENLLWSNLRGADGAKSESLLRILDFGLARPVGDADRPRGAGTIGYCAPEFLNNQPADGRADWYSAGIILYEWVYGTRPYAAQEPAIEIAGHLEGTPNFELPQLRPAPEWAKEVIARLLAKAADKRADDEPSLLAFMAEFDPALEPAFLLNEQLKWHARSEAHHLRSHEAELLDALHADLTNGLPALWSVQTHGTPSNAWLERAAALCAHMGYEVSILPQTNNARILSDRCGVQDPESRIRIQFSDSPNADPRPSDGDSFRSVMLLEWNRNEVRDYLRGVVGDDDVAEAWTDSIHRATCGLPCAVRDLIDHLLESGAMAIDPDGWALDEATIASWMALHSDEYVIQTMGSLEPVERQLCEWFALAEGFASRPILNKVWQDQDIDTVLHSLAARGVIVGSIDSYDHNFGMRLRLFAHDEVLRAGMGSDQLRSRSLSLAQELANSTIEPAATRAAILAHAYSRAEVWDKASEECLNAATFAIKADDRERAMRYILMAQQSAKRIGDEKTRSHWLGHARMVEGDLQKAVGQLDSARRIYRELLVLCRKSGDRRLLAETLHDLADLYHTTQRYSKGIYAERQAMRIWQELNDRAELSRSLNSLGNLHRIAADYPRALEFYTKAIEIQRELGLEKLAAINLNNIGIIHWLQYDFAGADRCFQEALAIHERLDAAVEIARVLNNLGAIGFVQGRLPEAHEYFLRAAQINADSGARSEELFNRWNLVEVALEAGDLRTAVGSGEKVLRACMEIGEHATAAEVAALLSDSYARVGDERRSRANYEESRGLSATLKNDDLQLHLDLSQVAQHIRFGQFESARTLLDAIAPMGRPSANRYRYLDALILRAQLVIASGDTSGVPDIWRTGAAEAYAIFAPHKRAQLASVCVTSNIDGPLSGEWTAEVSDFLGERPRWHWASKFHLHVARLSLQKRQFERALENLDAIVSQLRQDGFGDMLWRALVLQAEINHALADYEPAMRALEEAGRVLKFVASTVDVEEERTAYLNCDDARTLRRIQERITQLVS